MSMTVEKRKTRLIGAILVERGLLTPDQLKAALALQEEKGGLLGEIVTAEFGVSQVELSQAIAEQLAELEAGGRSELSGANSDPEPRRADGSSDTAAQLRIGDALLDLGLVSREQIDSALEVQRETGERLGEILVGQGTISRLELAGALSEHWSSMTKLRLPGEPGAPAQGGKSERLRAELETLVVRLEGLSVGLDERLVARNLELSAQLERLSARFDEFAETASEDGPSDRSRGFDRELSAQLERLSARFDEVAGAGVGEELQARLAAVDDAQRRGEEVLGGVASGLAALREQTEEKLGAIMAAQVGMSDVPVVDVDGLVVRLEGLSAGMEERVVARDRELSAQLERLSARFDEFAETASDDGLNDRSLGFDRELSAQLERLSARFDEVAGTGVASGVDVEGLVVRLEGLSAGLDERLVARNLELSAQLERLSARFDEFAETASEDGSSDRSLGFDRELSAQLERLSARFDEVAGAGVASGVDVDGLVVRLEGLSAGVEERVVARDRELSAQLERLSARFDEVAGAAHETIGATSDASANVVLGAAEAATGSSEGKRKKKGKKKSKPA